MVNSKVAELGQKILPEKDIVKLDGKIIKKEKKVYILLNKPVGYVTTVTDERERKTVMDLLKNVKEKVVPVRKIRYVYIWTFIIIKRRRFYI